MKTASPLKVVRNTSQVKPKREPKERGPLSVIEQVRESLKPKNRLSTVFGFCWGGLVPLGTYSLAHVELYDSLAHSDISEFMELWNRPLTYMALGGLLYSALTVYGWSERAFQSGAKAFGFVVLVEGIMILSHQTWLSLTCLAYLIVINGIATGVNLSLEKPKPKFSLDF